MYIAVSCNKLLTREFLREDGETWKERGDGRIKREQQGCQSGRGSEDGEMAKYIGLAYMIIYAAQGAW